MSRHGPLRRFFRQWRGKPGVLPWLQYQVMRVLLLFLRLLPERAIYAVVGGIGRLAWLSERRRAVGREHLGQAFPDMDAAERDRILKQSCRSLGIMGAESMVMGPKLKREGFARRLRLEAGTEELLQSLQGKPAIFIQGHLGSFEMGAGALAIYGLELAFPMRMPNNWYLGQRLQRAREAWGGVQVVERHGAVRALMRQLRGGRQVVLATDQSAHHNPIEVPWFGRPAPTERAAAALALKTGAAVVVSWCFRPPVGGDWLLGARLVEEGGAPREADDAALVDLLTRVHAVLEEAIRRHPEQYLWIHDRYRSRT